MYGIREVIACGIHGGQNFGRKLEPARTSTRRVKLSYTYSYFKLLLSYQRTVGARIHESLTYNRVKWPDTPAALQERFGANGLKLPYIEPKIRNRSASFVLDTLVVVVLSVSHHSRSTNLV